MQNSKLIQRIQSLFSKGVQSDDTRLSNRHIYYKLLTLRNKLLAQKIKKNQKINAWNYQTISCVELIKVSEVDCPCVCVKGCTTLRTKYKLPKPLSDLGRHIIQYVTGINPSNNETLIFNETTVQIKNYRLHDKYTGNKRDFYIYNDYLYITNDKELELISITGIFSDPDEVDNFVTKCSEEIIDCTSMLDKEFRLDEDLIEDMITISSEELIKYFSETKEDKQNNANNGS